MFPDEAFQVTDLSEVVPWTVAVNVRVPVVIEEAEEGEIVTEVTTGPGGGAGELTVTVAEDDLLASALLVAVTWAIPGVAGAV
jgi:hypothetical protein